MRLPHPDVISAALGIPRMSPKAFYTPALMWWCKAEARGRGRSVTTATTAPSDAGAQPSIEPRPRTALPVYLLVALLAVLLAGCGIINPPRPPDCPVCPPTPEPTPTPTPTPTPPTMSGPWCAQAGLNCGCIDQPPGQQPGCVVCDAAAPGGVSNIGQVPVCPPSSPPPTPGPVPTPNPAYTLPPFPPNATALATKPPQALNDAVTTALLAAASRHGQCNVGGDCSLGKDPQAAIQEVMAELHVGHVYAGQDEPGVSDEFVASIAGDTRYAYHGVKWPQVSGVDDAKVVWPGMPSQACFGGKDAQGTPSGLGCPGVGGGSFRGQWVCAGGCPFPGSSGGTCALVPADVEYWRFELKPHGGQLLDLTPYICGGGTREKMVNAGASCGSSCCALSVEKGAVNEACQLALYGIPLWAPVSGLTYFVQDTGPFTVKIASGSGRISSAGSKGGGTPVTWPVAAASPACTVGTDGFCQ